MTFDTVNPCCRNLRSTVEQLTRQLANQSNERKKYEDLQQKLQLIEEQSSESNAIIEKLTTQLCELKSQQQKVQKEFEEAKKREGELTKQLQLSENTVMALKMKADMADCFKQKFHHSVQICDEIQKKRITMGDSFKVVVGMCKQYKTNYDEVVAQCEKLKKENITAADRLKYCKRHTPTLLRLVDELTPLAGNLPYQTRRRIDTFASPEVRTQLLGSKKDYQQESDDGMANDIEALVLNGVKANPPKKAAPQPRKRETNNGGKRGKCIEQHNVEENEKLMEAKLQQKLAKGESEQNQPISEIVGGHRTIHGQKGTTVRQQQAEMMPVKERIAQMKAEENKTAVPSKSSSHEAPPKEEKEESTESVKLTSESAEDLFGNIDDLNSLSSLEDDASDTMTSVENPLKRKAEIEEVSPVKRMVETLDDDQMENENNCVKYKRMPPDESQFQKILDVAIEQMKHFVCQLDLFKRCYKLTDQKESIVNIQFMQRITRDPQPQMVEEFALKSSVLIPLLNNISSCAGLHCDKKSVLLNFLSTSLDRARQIDEFLSHHRENAPAHRMLLLDIVQKFSNVLTKNPIIM